MTERRTRLVTGTASLLRRLRLTPRERKPRWRYSVAEPAAPVEPPITFIAPPKMPEAELRELRRRAHP